MAQVRIILNRAGIARITQERVMRAARAVGNESARRVNVDTGNLRSTRSVQNLGGARARVAYRAKYARYVHDGWHRGRGGYGGNPYLTSAVREVLARYARRKAS